jgi:hypothetical protein
MKVYVITKGNYSDYHICAVTLDEQEAERLRKVYNDSYDEAVVEEYDTDGEEAKRGLDGRVPYNVYFGKGYTSVSMSYTTPEEFKPSIYLGPYYDTVDLFATDSEAAVKIAAEKRAQARAEKEGLT